MQLLFTSRTNPQLNLTPHFSIYILNIPEHKPTGQTHLNHPEITDSVLSLVSESPQLPKLCNIHQGQQVRILDGANATKLPIKFASPLQSFLLAITVAKKPIVNLRGGVIFKMSDLKYSVQVAVDEASCWHVLSNLESSCCTCVAHLLHIPPTSFHTDSKLCALIFRVRFAQGKIFCMIHGALITLDETATTT